MREYGQIKGELEYLKFDATQRMKQIAARSRLDEMIDEATGYDKAQARELIRVLCRVGHRQKRLGENKDREITLGIIRRLQDFKQIGEKG